MSGQMRPREVDICQCHMKPKKDTLLNEWAYEAHRRLIEVNVIWSPPSLPSLNVSAYEAHGRLIHLGFIFCFCATLVCFYSLWNWMFLDVDQWFMQDWIIVRTSKITVLKKKYQMQSKHSLIKDPFSFLSVHCTGESGVLKLRTHTCSTIVNT